MSPSKLSLSIGNTFGLDIRAKKMIFADSIEKLCQAWQLSQQSNLPFLLLGAGSNILLLEDFAGVVAMNRLRGVVVSEAPSHWHIHCAAGENWHQFVSQITEQGITGLENLALIQGMVGTAPVQNIGAYGVELKDVCEYIDLLNLQNGTVQRLSATECQFGYRDSLFKHQYQQGYAIVAVGFCLTKDWQPKINYGELRQLSGANVTSKQIFAEICRVRRAKLPDPKIFGNAGSFFKNPIVEKKVAEKVLNHYPDAPHYQQNDGKIKFAAGWLIEQAQLKGVQIGGAAVHQQQALVIINLGNAKPVDIIALAAKIRKCVFAKFSILLEPEVRFIAANGEVDAVGVIS